MHIEATNSGIARLRIHQWRRQVTRIAATLLTLCALAPTIASAQTSTAATARNDSASLRGTVVSRESGLPLPYAIVSIPSLGIDRFANEQGVFTFARLPVGSHRVRARQLGHSPIELDVTVAIGPVQELRFALPRLATRIATMRVTEDWECESPAASRAALAAEALVIFEQLQQNADRLKLLAKQFPFSVSTERSFLLLYPDGGERLEAVDTSTVRSADHKVYRPGQVVVNVRDRGKRVSMLQVPTLIDFADAEFQKNHCFVVRGIEEAPGSAPLVRVDFKAWRKIKTPDVHGSVFLDTGTFRLRRSEIRLSKIPKEVAGLTDVFVTTKFVDLRPGLPVVQHIRGVNRMQRVSMAQRVTATVEEQVSLNVQFLKARPDSSETP